MELKKSYERVGGRTEEPREVRNSSGRPTLSANLDPWRLSETYKAGPRPPTVCSRHAAWSLCGPPNNWSRGCPWLLPACGSCPNWAEIFTHDYNSFLSYPPFIFPPLPPTSPYIHPLKYKSSVYINIDRYKYILLTLINIIHIWLTTGALAAYHWPWRKLILSE